MNFDKEAIFLGTKDMTLKDGTVLVSVTFYVDGAAVEVNVLSSNVAIMSAVKGLKFGDSCTATFTLRKADKLYRLSLSGLA